MFKVANRCRYQPGMAPGTVPQQVCSLTHFSNVCFLFTTGILELAECPPDEGINDFAQQVSQMKRQKNEKK